jgi:hypothetical protein
MLNASDQSQPEGFAHDPAHRGYHAVYREDTTNHCPGCGRTHWFVGRLSAECGFCATALPLENSQMGWGTHSRNRTAPQFTLMAA